jgi:amino acid transporter
LAKTGFERNATGLVRGISAYRAFVLNLMITSPGFMLIFLVIGQGLFPGAYLPVSSLLALVPSIIIALVYAQLSIAYPRSGGDYVFVGRILHPSIGFMVNFVFTLINISVIGVEAVWITTMGLGPMLNALTAITGNTNLAALASTLTVPTNELLLGAVFAVVLPLVMFFGFKATFRLNTVFFAFSVFAILVFIVALASTTNSTFIANFNSLSSTPYGKVISSAQSAGADLSFSSGDTLLGVVYCMLAVYGFTVSTYVGGEVKDPQRSQTIGMIVSPIAYIILMTVAALVTYSSMGHDFLASISFLALNGNPNYTLPASLPILQFLGGYGTRSAIVEAILGIGLLTTLFAYMLTASFTSVRVLFAWSFDSVIPRKFAQVDERYHVPQYSVLAIILIDLLFVVLTIYTSIATAFTYVVTGSFVGLIFVGLAALVFPFRKRDVFASSPSLTNMEIGGVPLISVLGFALIIVGVLIAYGSLLPALVGPLNPSYILVVAALFVTGFVFYWVSYAIQRSRGVPVHKLHSEIPPE